LDFLKSAARGCCFSEGQIYKFLPLIVKNPSAGVALKYACWPNVM
jgi:hypothetical protein